MLRAESKRSPFNATSDRLTSGRTKGRNVPRDTTDVTIIKQFDRAEISPFYFGNEERYKDKIELGTMPAEVYSTQILKHKLPHSTVKKAMESSTKATIRHLR